MSLLKNIGGIRITATNKRNEVFLFLNYSGKITPVAASLATGLFRSKEYYNQGTSRSSEKHINLFGRYLVEELGQDVRKWETISQNDLEEKTLFII